MGGSVACGVTRRLHRQRNQAAPLLAAGPRASRKTRRRPPPERAPQTTAPVSRILPAALVASTLWLFYGCASPTHPDRSVGALFTQLPSSHTGVSFRNSLRETRAFNVFSYRNYYDGGGVGLADFNDDGLVDIFLTANQESNRLYLNRGDFRFEDVTQKAGVAGSRPWSTGVSVADVNGDGRQDIYVSNSGDIPGDDRSNELFINQGGAVPRFSEDAAVYGLADKGYSTHAAFFDYDRDGDLDCYLMNNSSRPLSSFAATNIRETRHDGGGDKLMRNDDGRFIDVSAAAGLYSSEIGFGLGVSIGDIDGDGWLDIYVSNDFFERDYLYINDRDGSFREDLEARMRHISLSSMGADIADINNDGLLDIYVTDMLPPDDFRRKTTSTFDSWRAYQQGQKNGFHHQFMRNMLHLNNGDATFSEIGQIAGVAATDWSWSALIADYDLDGDKDIFVANGIYRDLTDQDFIAFFADRAAIASWIRDNGGDMRKLLSALPSTPLSNYLFASEGDLTFTDRAAEWGLGASTYSNGAAYGDLDNDGDLDLVVNNVNQEALLYRNETDALLGNAFLQVRLEGSGGNPFAVGARATAHHQGEVFTLEQVPTRGFQSTVDPLLTFGLGAARRVDSLVVAWPDGLVSVLPGLAVNQRLTLRQAQARKRASKPATAQERRFEDVTSDIGLSFAHQENDFVDFDREPLLPKMLSREGPRLAVGDVNGDGREDIFVGGAKHQAAALLIQNKESFERTNLALFARDAISEDQGAAFFDADGDGDLDLYVVSGGSEYARRAPGLQDRLYLNIGSGVFHKAANHLPPLFQSGSCIAPADYDGDGDVDLLVGGRLTPWAYGVPPQSALLENDGQGRFTDVTKHVAPALLDIGMVTDAVWSDFDGDGRVDLALAGEWMPLSILGNTGSGLRPAQNTGLGGSHGLWNRLLAADIDGDGDEDLVAGNLGLNTPWRASAMEPLTMHVHDFDRDGRTEQIISLYVDGKSVPIPLKNDLTAHFAFLGQRYERHADYAGERVVDIFAADELQGALVLEAHTLATALALNAGDGTFELENLPFEAQFSPVYAIEAEDVDADGRLDLLLAGNFHAAPPALGRMDASYGLFLRGAPSGSFTAVPESGFLVAGEARDMASVAHSAHGRLVVVAKNDDAPQIFSIK